MHQKTKMKRETVVLLLSYYLGENSLDLSPFERMDMLLITLDGLGLIDREKIDLEAA